MGELAPLLKVGELRWPPIGERPPEREKGVGEGVLRLAKLVGDGGLAVGDGVLRLLTAAVASAEGVTGPLHAGSYASRGVTMVWSP